MLPRKAAADEKETHTDFRQDLLDGKRGKKSQETAKATEQK